MILWPFFIGMIAGFIALHLTITFQRKHLSKLKRLLPATLLLLLGMIFMIFGAFNYTFIGKSILFFGLALVLFSFMAFSTIMNAEKHRERAI